MKKSHFITLIFAIVGAMIFGLGMCMTLIEQWNAFNEGIIVGVIGIVILLVGWIVYRKLEGKQPIHWNIKTVGCVLIGLLGALCLGAGMSLTMVFEQLILGIIVSCIGIIALLCLIPLTIGLH